MLFAGIGMIFTQVCEAGAEDLHEREILGCIEKIHKGELRLQV